MIKTNNLYFFYDDCSNINIIPNSLEHAYLLILDNNLQGAKQIFNVIDSPRAKWGSVLVNILEQYLQILPTYFQIRNFFEIDLDFLIKNNKVDQIECLIGALDALSHINQEIYKYAARVMFENKLYSLALKYMQCSKKCLYHDPELHFMLSKYYLKFNDYNKAYESINICLDQLPDYYPAKVLRKEIEQMII